MAGPSWDCWFDDFGFCLMEILKKYWKIVGNACSLLSRRELRAILVNIRIEFSIGKLCRSLFVLAKPMWETTGFTFILEKNYHRWFRWKEHHMELYFSYANCQGYGIIYLLTMDSLSHTHTHESTFLTRMLLTNMNLIKHFNRKIILSRSEIWN